MFAGIRSFSIRVILLIACILVGLMISQQYFTPFTFQDSNLEISASQLQIKYNTVEERPLFGVIQDGRMNIGCGILELGSLSAAFDRLIRITKPFCRSSGDGAEALFREKVPIITKPQRIHWLNGTAIPLGAACATIREPYDTVPNVAHFALYYTTPMTFSIMISLLSAARVMRARQIFIWYERMPYGVYWTYLVERTPDATTRFVFVQHKLPEHIYGQRINIIQHKVDFLRLNALLVFGGVYFDTDVVIVRNLSPLRNHTVTLGRQSADGLCNGIIFSRPGAIFLALWHLAYQCLNDAVWSYHSVQLPNVMHRNWPNLLHVEADSLHIPTWENADKVLMSNWSAFDWTKKNYAVHFWQVVTASGLPKNFKEASESRNTFGMLARWILNL